MTKQKTKFKERYDITCPHCQTAMQCAPSMFHQMGMFELGGGTCTDCGQVMEIHFNPETNSMSTHPLRVEIQEKADD